MNFIGTGGGDTLVGTADDDVFDMSQGGHDFVKGLAGDDTFLFGDQFFATDRIYGGDGLDTLVLDGPYQEQTRLHAKTIVGVEVIELDGFHSYSLKLNDGNVAAGDTLTVVSKVSNGNSISVDGHSELDGMFRFEGSPENDALRGGAMADTLIGGGGHDVLNGGGGDDVLIGGSGADHMTGGPGSDRFVYTSSSDSTLGFKDIILDLANNDKIDLSGIDADTGLDGDQAFTLATAFSGHAGEAVLSYDHATRLTSLSLDVDGDGKADAAITMSGEHTDFTRFVL